MKTKELAALLNGREMRIEITSAEEAKARANGLVVVFGASDDLMEFRGAISDELGANDGCTARITPHGILPEWESMSEATEAAAALYFTKKASGFKEIKALWCAEPGYSWTYRTEIPHATFEIMEDGEPYCRGIVFSLADAFTSSDAGAQNPLSLCEQRAVLADLMGLECLINYHDCQETMADAMEPGAGKSNEARALELLKLGREIIAKDPDIWFDEQKVSFKLRHSEKTQ